MSIFNLFAAVGIVITVIGLGACFFVFFMPTDALDEVLNTEDK
jgi:hypothetical protein